MIWWCIFEFVEIENSVCTQTEVRGDGRNVVMLMVPNRIFQVEGVPAQLSWICSMFEVPEYLTEGVPALLMFLLPWVVVFRLVSTGEFLIEL